MNKRKRKTIVTDINQVETYRSKDGGKHVSGEDVFSSKVRWACIFSVRGILKLGRKDANLLAMNEREMNSRDDSIAKRIRCASVVSLSPPTVER